MKKPGIYKSEAGEALMRQWYEKFKAQLTFSFEEKVVTTRLGDTHLIISGENEAIPIVFLHGAMSGAPHALGELGNIPAQHRLYTIDIPGQSVASVQVRPSEKNDEHAQWLNEVVDQLKLDQFILMGVSWGAFSALNFACLYPQRLKGLVLMTPAAIVNGNAVTALLKMTLPMIRYRLFPSVRNRDFAFRHLFTTPHPLWSPFIADAMKHTLMNFSAPPLVTPEKTRQIKAPVYIFAADKDISFPGLPLIARSKKLFPNLIGTHMFENSCHCPPFDKAFTAQFEKRLEGVLQQMKVEETGS